MKPEEEIKQELVDPDSDAGSLQAAQNTELEPCQVSRKELYWRWLRYRPLHHQQTPIIPGYRGDTGNNLHYPEIGCFLHQADTRYILHQADTRYILNQADTRYTPNHPETGYILHQAGTRSLLHQADTRFTINHPEIGDSLHQPTIQHSLLISRRTPHA